MAKQTSTRETPSNTDVAPTPSITPQPQALEVDAPIISSELYGTITAEAMEKDSYLTVDSRMDRLDITIKFSIKEAPEIRLNDVVDSSGQPGAREILIPQKYLTMSMGYTLVVWYEGTVSGKPAVSLTKEVGVTFYSAEQSKALAPRLRDEKVFQNTPTYDMHDHQGDEIVEIPIPPLAQVGDKIYCSVVIEQFSGKPVFYIVAYGYALTLEDIASGKKLEFPIPRGWLARQKPRYESITCQAAWITSGEEPQPPAEVENPDEETRLPRNALQIQHRRTAAFIGDQGLENLQPPHLRQSAFFDDKWCLNPELTKNGGDVDAPQLDTYAGDQVCFYVSGPGYGSKLLGCVEIKNDGDPASVKLPRCVIACFFNKSMTLSYTVQFPNLMGPEPQSPERVVDVLTPRLSKSEIAEATHGKVNLNIFSEDASAFVHIGDYATCSTFCWMWITGEHEDGSSYQSEILTKAPVTEDWKNKGVETFISRDELQSLADCSDFELHFAVSFCEAFDRSEAIEALAATFHIIQEELVLPAPKVTQAEGDELEPWNAQDGVEVIVNYLRMSDKHEISVCWKRPNGLCWELKSETGNRDGVVKFSLPADAAIESMSETVEITYIVITKCREAQTSASLSLKINLPTRLKKPNVLEATPPGVDHGILDMRAITGNANSFEDPMWFLRKGQKCWLRATGTDKNGFSYTFDVYANRTVTDEEATKGVAGPIQHALLDRLKNNSTLTLAFSVSTQGNLKENVVCPVRVLTVKAVLNDFTPFIGGNWNSWRLGSAANGELVYGSHAGKSCLVNWTHRPAVLGVVLYKDFTGLEVNRRYEFSMIACSLNATPALPKLSLRTNAGAVTNVTTFSSTAWAPLKGSFVASAESMRLEILNHEVAGYGNDYAFTDIRVHG
ncbi:hypothetical protein CRN80_18475 [Pseudomonas sp. FDAARGOS_380]|uniref:hypothetical protein n=1 Tax=unclassified Pseudomonas TaxID=196821 RepID=UPI000BFB8AF0|nr:MULTISPECIES: hypothetical protein [unclassified Pseudomonas]ATN11509.1 hypothetical protein CRN80_18475 [Pseudomonas sp. FDAARGOS_380]NMX25265.1 hypothetical protein [Pseudomonas sp. WS 5406]